MFRRLWVILDHKYAAPSTLHDFTSPIMLRRYSTMNEESKTDK